MSADFVCTAGLPGCTSERDHDGGGDLGPWRSHQLTDGFMPPVEGERRRIRSDWDWKCAPTYTVKFDVKATACVTENGATHEFVYLDVDDRRRTTLTGDAAHSLGLSLIEAAYRAGYITRAEAFEDLAARFDRADDLRPAVAA